jgi:hypothetical protein
MECPGAARGKAYRSGIVVPESRSGPECPCVFLGDATNVAANSPLAI